MKHIHLFLAAVICLMFGSTLQAQTQPQEVTLTVSSDGPSKDEATKNALRSAIEQTYGAFVSANTSILNDEMVKDEIVTVSNGSIKDYTEVSSVPDGKGGYFVTLTATVSLPHLITYAKNHGSECEFAGNTFGMEMKLWELNKESELKALKNLQTTLSKMENLCDYKLEISEPYLEGDNVIAKFIIQPCKNENTENFLNIYFATLESLTAYEGTLMNNDGRRSHKVYKADDCIGGVEIYLRNEESVRVLDEIRENCLRSILFDYVINDNKTSPSLLQIKQFYKKLGGMYDSEIEKEDFVSGYKLCEVPIHHVHKVASDLTLSELEGVIKKIKLGCAKRGEYPFIFPMETVINGIFDLYAPIKSANDIKKFIRSVITGSITIPKETISEYSKLWVEPKNK